MKKIKFFVAAGCAIVILVTGVFIISAVSISGKAKITGFAPASFSVKGEAEQQILDFIGKIKNLAERNKKILKLNIIKLKIGVVGYADKTGKESKNDIVAKERSMQVASYVQDNLPEAFVTSYSKGDDINERAVVIAYSFDVNYLATVLYAVGAIVFIVFLGGISINFVEPKRTGIPTTQGVWLDVAGYSVWAVFDGKKFISPFKTANGGTIERDSKKGIMDSLRGCLKENSSFQSQRDALTKKGIIKII